jgi:hypothetical protein
MREKSGPNGPLRSLKGVSKQTKLRHFFTLITLNAPQRRFEGTKSAKP